MYLSHYVKKIEIEDDYQLLFNINSGKIIKINNERLEYILKQPDNEIPHFLKENFLTSNINREIDKINERYYEDKKKGDHLILTIMLNKDCNMKCKYCHENGFKNGVYLDDKIANLILKKLRRYILVNKFKKVSIYYYGGEPFLSISRIDTLSKAILKLQNELKFELDFSISTNGTLLNDKSVDILVSNHIKSVQVSIDGPKFIHDKRRQLSGKSSFDIIMKNINKYKEHINFLIRCNIDKHNYLYFDQLLKELKFRIGINDLNFYFDFVSNTHNQTKHNHKYIFSTEEQMQIIKELWRIQINNNIKLKSKNIFEGRCGDISMANLTIDINGNLYTCPGLCSLENFKVGNIKYGYYPVMHDLICNKLSNKCSKCEFLLVCRGGCRAQAVINNKSINSCCCKKEYYNNVLPEYIRLKYDI
ncbi:MAG: radical SAM protein [Tissierellia bacterium]|nr:radical SAM protein [Tissierellia bacterium]